MRLLTIHQFALIVLALSAGCSSNVGEPSSPKAQIGQQDTARGTVKEPEVTRPSESSLSFEVLRQWSIPKSHTPAGGTGLEILVSPKSNRDEVLNLARSLRAKYAVNHRAFNLSIFDNREAWENSNNEQYPQEKYMKHLLAVVFVNPNTGFDETRWSAEGRDH